MSSPLINFEKWCINLEPIPEATPETKLIFGERIEKGNAHLKDLSHDEREARTSALENIINDAIQISLEKPVYLVTNCEPIKNLEIIVPAQNGETFDPYKITEEQKCNFSVLEVLKGDLIVEGAIVGKLDINGPGTETINLKNCCIKEIEIHNSRRINLTLNNCLIGKLDLTTKSINTLNVNEGAIISILCPPPDGDNPFIGSVTLQDVYFPIKKSLLFEGPQQYRNFRAHFEALQNAPAANLMRAKQLAAEYETETGLSKLFLGLYSLVSDYGVKPGKPLWGILIVYILMGFIIGACKGFWESLILPLQAILYPIGILRNDSNFSDIHIFFKSFLLILALTADGLIIFIISGLRKRFKLH